MRSAFVIQFYNRILYRFRNIVIYDTALKCFENYITELYENKFKDFDSSQF